MIATVPEKYTIKHILAPTRITSEKQYDDYAETLMRLDGKAEKGHLNQQEESYAKILIGFLAEWDEKHHPIDDASPVEVLQTLMEANNLRQKDLVPIFGTESIVSEVLHQKRALTVNYIVGLSQRFNVSPAVFSSDDSGNGTVSGSTEKTHVPGVDVPPDRNGLDLTLHRPVPLDLDETSALDTQLAVFEQSAATAAGRKDDTVVPAERTEAREARLLAAPYPSEERLGGLIQPAKNILAAGEVRATPSNPAARIGFNWLA